MLTQFESRSPASRPSAHPSAHSPAQPSTLSSAHPPAHNATSRPSSRPFAVIPIPYNPLISIKPFQSIQFTQAI